MDEHRFIRCVGAEVGMIGALNESCRQYWGVLLIDSRPKE